MAIIDEVRSILEADSGDFATLLKLAGLDPRTDLRGCDLSNVDFGVFVADVLNLKRCDLTSADLSRIKVRELNTDGADIAGARFPPEHEKSVRLLQLGLRQRFDALKMIALAIHRFHVRPFVTERLFDSLLTERRLIFAGFRSFSEHDNYVEQLKERALKDVGPPFVGRFLSFTGDYQRQFNLLINRRATRLSPTGDSDEIDRLFLDTFAGLLALPEVSADVGLTLQRRRFVKTLEEVSHANVNAFVFCGFPPLSRRLWTEVSRSSRNLRIAVLMPTSHLSRIESDRKQLFPNPVIIVPHNMSDNNDTERLIRELIGYKIIAPDIVDELLTNLDKLRDYTGRFRHYDVAELKNFLLDKLFDIARRRVPKKTDQLEGLGALTQR